MVKGISVIGLVITMVIAVIALILLWLFYQKILPVFPAIVEAAIQAIKGWLGL